MGTTDRTTAGDPSGGDTVSVPGTSVRLTTQRTLAAWLSVGLEVGARARDAFGGPVGSSARLLAPGLALLAVLLQIGYPLAHGDGRARLAVLVVVVLATACLVHAAVTRSPATASLVLLISGGIGFAAELVGVHTGIPFGGYRYTGELGVQVFDVPVVVALAWTMLAWPSAVVARRLVRGRVARVLVGAWALAAADLFLDPQLVALHAWTWDDPTPHLPGMSLVPLTNYAGWALVSLVMSAVLQQVVGDGPDACPVAIYLWLWIGWTVAQVVFLDLRGAAGWGFVGMGVVAVPLIGRGLRAQRSGAGVRSS